MDDTPPKQGSPPLILQPPPPPEPELPRFLPPTPEPPPEHALFGDLTPTWTMGQGRDYVQNGLHTGVTCPTCGQYAKRYRRPIHYDMARWLRWVVHRWERSSTWVDVKGCDVRGGDYAKLQHWRLVEAKTAAPLPPTTAKRRAKSERSAGLWRPTLQGVEFVYGRLAVPSHVFLYDNHVLGFAPTYVSFEEALAVRFDPSAVME